MKLDEVTKIGPKNEGMKEDPSHDINHKKDANYTKGEIK